MIIGDGIMLGAGGETASIFVTGLSETDTVTATKDGKPIVGKWTQIPNPAIVVPAGYTQLEYIESTGTQYIDIGVVPSSKTNIDTKLFNKNKTKDWYLTDSEQVELGVVSAVVEDIYSIL